MAAYPNGTQLLVRWNNDGDPACARIVCGHFGGHSERYSVLTPDGAMTDEDYSGDDVAWVRVRPPGGLPFGVQIDDIEDMQAIPSGDELNALFIEAAADIRKILNRNHGRAGRSMPAAHPDARVGPPPLHNLDRDAQPAPDKAPDPLPGRASGGLAALAQAIGGGGGQAVREESAARPPDTSDARVLTVEYDQQGQRFRNFRDAVNISEEVKWPDWPIPGKITTVLWCLRFMLNRAGSPTMWHQTFITLGKLNPNDHQIAFHDALCRILETSVCYDQLNCPCLAGLELICRQIQCIEERYKDKFCGGDAGGTGSLEHHLMSGLQSRAQLCICPALNDWLADELRKQTAVDKERRKAREERTLIKPDKKGGPG